MTFINHKDTSAWSVIIDCIQEEDDNGDGHNEFKLELHASPGGGWYWKIKGEVAWDFEHDIPKLKTQLEKIVEVLGWD